MTSSTAIEPPAGSDQQRRRAAILTAMSQVPPQRRRRLRIVVATFLGFGVIGYAAVMYYGFDPSQAQVGLRKDVPWHYAALMAHILTASVALVLGPLQFIRRLRRIPRVHRYIGRAYLFAGVIPSSLVGIPVALLSTAGPVAAGGLLAGDIAWLVTAVVAYRLARQQHYREHAQWMLRNFALTFAAVTFRLWLGLTILAQLPLLESTYGGDFGELFNTAYLTTCWLAFLPNLLVVNWFLRRSGRRRKDGGRGQPGRLSMSNSGTSSAGAKPKTRP